MAQISIKDNEKKKSFKGTVASWNETYRDIVILQGENKGKPRYSTKAKGCLTSEEFKAQQEDKKKAAELANSDASKAEGNQGENDNAGAGENLGSGGDTEDKGNENQGDGNDGGDSGDQGDGAQD